jgi:hypothetical protein
LSHCLALAQGATLAAAAYPLTTPRALSRTPSTKESIGRGPSLEPSRLGASPRMRNCRHLARTEDPRLQTSQHIPCTGQNYPRSSAPSRSIAGTPPLEGPGDNGDLVGAERCRGPLRQSGTTPTNSNQESKHASAFFLLPPFVLFLAIKSFD